MPEQFNPHTASGASGAPRVTLSTKRYISTCAGCGHLFEAARKDVLTCGGACRVRAHRNGRLKLLRENAKAWRVPIALTLQAGALKILCPDLEPKIMAGTLTLDEAQPQMAAAYDRRIVQLMKWLHENKTAPGDEAGAGAACDDVEW